MITVYDDCSQLCNNVGGGQPGHHPQVPHANMTVVLLIPNLAQVSLPMSLPEAMCRHSSLLNSLKNC